MTKQNVEKAIEEGLPFEIRMADGRAYRVSSSHHIAVGPTALIVISEEDWQPHWLPLLTITGISYLRREPSQPV